MTTSRLYMIKITDKIKCCGCAACAQICPKQCIAMTEDNEGFLYPIVDEAQCTGCGLCEKICHELHPYDEREPQQVLAAINKDEAIRLKSSSGGIFYILASQTIAEGGVVFGARFDSEWQVVIDYSETAEGIEEFIGSKYVQARTEKAFADAKRFLQEGRKVLFSGTPCQIAALRHFLRKDYDNLLAVDIVCHGTPSPKVWRMYLAEVLRDCHCVSKIEFRKKSKGWKISSFNLQYNESDKTVSMLSHFVENPYMKAFLYNIILRPSCYDCKAKAGRSHSDITIADFWGINTLMCDMDDDKGTSMVFLNTDKGIAAFDFKKVRTHTFEYKAIKPYNTACYSSANEFQHRKQFFDELDKQESVIAFIEHVTRPTRQHRFRRFLMRCKHFVKSKIQFGGGNLRNIPKNDTHTQTSVPITFPVHPRIVAISFRNKERGWKEYCMDVRVTECKN